MNIQMTFLGAKTIWSLSWAQVYKRLNALCWGCRRTIHTLILQALNHLLKALGGSRDQATEKERG